MSTITNPFEHSVPGSDKFWKLFDYLFNDSRIESWEHSGRWFPRRPSLTYQLHLRLGHPSHHIGEVIMRLHNTDIVKVRVDTEKRTVVSIAVTYGGWFTMTTRKYISKAISDLMPGSYVRDRVNKLPAGIVTPIEHYAAVIGDSDPTHRSHIGSGAHRRLRWDPVQNYASNYRTVEIRHGGGTNIRFMGPDTRITLYATGTTVVDNGTPGPMVLRRLRDNDKAMRAARADVEAYLESVVGGNYDTLTEYRSTMRNERAWSLATGIADLTALYSGYYDGKVSIEELAIRVPLDIVTTKDEPTPKLYLGTPVTADFLEVVAEPHLIDAFKRKRKEVVV
jgi:hypothetical protein